MRIAIAGGTGAVGRHLVGQAERQGHDVIILSRAHGIDLVAGEGLNLAGVDAVIDVSGPGKSEKGNPAAFFERVTTNLLNAEEAAGVAQHTALSVVGAAKIDAGYYAGKRVQEDLVAAGSTPWTILRATQFFEFAEQTAVPVGPWVLSPKVRSQPIAAASVASELLRLTEAAVLRRSTSALGVHEIAGPQERRIADLLRELMGARADARRVLELPMPGRFGRGLRDGSILPGPAATIDEVTFEDWFEEQRGRG